ncbi:MAG: hypothetical protein WD002_09400 [Pseudomonadales bacterium]
MSGDDDEVDRESYYQAAADVWERGCRGDTLEEADYKRFVGLARDRFYTFLMSVRHSELQGDAEKIQSLIRSLALDLTRSPGLEREWLASEFSDDEFGELVSAMIDEVRGQ